MKYFYDVGDIVTDCLKHIDEAKDHAVVVCNYEMVLDFVNEILKNTDLVLKEFDTETDCEGPFIVDIWYDGELYILGALTSKGKYFNPSCDYILVSNEYADGFKKDWPDANFIEFKCGMEEPDDYVICMNEDNKGFCSCRELPDGMGTTQFVYRGTEKLTNNDVHRILWEYGKF